MDVFLSPAQKPGARGETPSGLKNDVHRADQLYQDTDNGDRDRGLRRIASAIRLSSSTSRQAPANTTARQSSPSAESQHQTSRESTDSLPALNDAPDPSQPIRAVPASSALDFCSSPLADLTTLTTAQLHDQDEEGPFISHIVSPGLSSGIQRKTSQSSFLSLMAEEPENMEPIWMRGPCSTAHPVKMPIRTSPERQKAAARPLGIHRTPPQVVATASQSTLRSTKVSMTPVISGVYEASEADDTSQGTENDNAVEEGCGSPSPSTKRAAVEHGQAQPAIGSSTTIFATPSDPEQQVDYNSSQALITERRAAASQSYQSRARSSKSSPHKTALEIANELLAEFVDLSPKKNDIVIARPDHAEKSSATQVASSQSPPDEELPEIEPIYQRRSAHPTQSGKTNEADLTPPIQIPSSQTPSAPDPDEPFSSPPHHAMLPAIQETLPARVAATVRAPTPERSPSVSYVERRSPGYQQALVDPLPREAGPAFGGLPPAQPLTKQNLRRNEHVYRRIAEPSHSPCQPSLPDFDLPLSQLNNEKKRKYSFGLSGNGKRAFATPSPSPSIIQAQQAASSPRADWQSKGKRGGSSKRHEGDQRSASIGPSRSVASVASTFSLSPRTRDRSRGKKGQKPAKKRSSTLHKSKSATELEADVSIEELLAILPKRRTRSAVQPKKPAKRQKRDADSDEEGESSDEEEEEISFEREDWDDSQSSSGASKATEYNEDLFLSKTAEKKQKEGIVPLKNKAAEPQPRKIQRQARPAARSSIRFGSVALSQNETYLANKERRLAEYAELDEFRLETEYGYFLPRQPKERQRRSTSRKRNR